MQVLQEIINNPADTTTVDLVFANTSEEDILLKDLLDDIAKKHKNVKVSYVLSHPKNEKAWKGFKGS